MNYAHVYSKLVETRRHRGHKREVGFEVHHVVPRALGGTNDKANLVKFTYREHFVAHRLLCKMYPSSSAVQYAFLCMIRDPHGRRNLTSRMSSTVKAQFSKFKRWHHANVFNPGKTDASRKKARQRMSGQGNPMRGRLPQENTTAAPHLVIFDDGTQQRFPYGKIGYETLGMSRSSWIAAVRKGSPVPKFKVTKIIKETT